ncbi:MAG TPA: YbhB/YbcL family Raf kinase inhibitor-like protein [Gammaproteobacteria bacterium]|nr:YbhB/YbcL family Raf kinase inhibitor-like protein [Gammaproteobacteria bacterium]
MRFTVEGLVDGDWLPDQFAFGVAHASERMRLGPNRNPGVHWSGEPAGTRTLVLLCYDDDVPAEAEDANREDRTIAHSARRTRFYHWILVDLAPGAECIGEGSVSNGVTPRGKKRREGPMGARQGLNDFTDFLRGDPELEGKYYGYDGPCPPWNDERLHRYHFVLHATDLDRCPVEGDFTGSEVEAALAGHVLASARVSGHYSLFPPHRERR